VQVDPIKPKLKPPGTKRLKLTCDILLSTSAFRLNLRRYIVAFPIILDEDIAKELDNLTSSRPKTPGMTVKDLGITPMVRTVIFNSVSA